MAARSRPDHYRVSASGLAEFQRCPRRYHYSHDLRRVPVQESEALTVGRAVHALLEVLWRGGFVGREAPDRLVAMVPSSDVGTKALHEMCGMVNTGEISVRDVPVVMAVLKRYELKRDTFNVLAVEEPFEVRIERPGHARALYGHRMVGRMDLVVEDGRGDRWVVDHKTTRQNIDGWGPYWQTLQIDGQMGAYVLAARQRWERVTGFVYDVLRIPGIRQCGTDEREAKRAGMAPEIAFGERLDRLLTEEHDQHYQWRHFVKTDDAIVQDRAILADQVMELVAARRADAWPRHPVSCNGHYGLCPYLSVCCGDVDLGDDLHFRTREMEHEREVIA